MGPGLLALLGAIAVAAWLIDYVAAAWRVRRTGASGLAMVGAGIDAVVGVLGGVAAGVAFVLGTVAKLALAFALPGIFVFTMSG